MNAGATIPAAGVVVPTTLCRVTGTVSSRPTEAVGIEVWLPTSWNHRFEGVGSGGFGGSIAYPELARASAQGFAAASTNTGHHGSSFGKAGEKLEWASNPVTLDDWGRNAIHLMTSATKQIAASYYGAAPRHSYFNGCSTGGAEAMSEAEFFPKDYDGIHAGSPGMAYSRLIQSFLWTAMPSQHDAQATLPDAALTLLHNAVLHACSDAKAVPGDTFLTTPARCAFNPAILACRPGQPSQDCLSPPQIAAVRQIYAPVRNARTGAEIYPGYVRGGEADPDRVPGRFSVTGWYMNQGALAGAVASPLLGTAVFEHPGWKWSDFNFGSDSDQIMRVLSAHIDAMSPDLRAFAARGGKLIMTQGWADAFNAPTLPVSYLMQVRQFMGSPDQFLRLFMVPGMGHCGGGPGPNAFGGPGQLPAPITDARHDVVAALIGWVEQSHAPKTIIATHYDQNIPSRGIAMQRPLCPYPQHSVYVGTGDSSKADSFICK